MVHLETKVKKETFKLNPLTVYAKSKINSEKALKKIASKKFKIFSLRLLLLVEKVQD